MANQQNHLRNRKQAVASEKEAIIQENIRSDQQDIHEPYQLTPLVQRSTLMRLDVGPFLVLYLICIAIDFTFESPFTTFIFAGILILHLCLVLAAQWNISFQAMIGYRVATLNEKEMTKWTHCYVQSMDSKGTGESAGIAPVYLLHKECSVAIVNFHDTVFRCASVDPDQDVTLWQPKAPAATQIYQFRPLHYPIHLPISWYLSWQGHPTLASATKAAQIYGPNTTVVRLPTFWDLLSQQVVAPFFLFQVFCVFLWSLDEYWYYAIFTLGALLMFESTVAYNRLHSLQRLHQAGQKGHGRLWVRRGGVDLEKRQWMAIPASELVPGDLVSLAANSADGTTVPADIVLTSGTAVCDEALLTGESVPQLKQALDALSSDGDVPLDMQDGQHKESILFGGTVLLATTTDNAAQLHTPDNGIVGLVLRTGFDTTQGNLLRTMAHSSKNADGIHTWDTFVFILMLLICALIAAGWVFHVGWNDERRNRFRLLLHVIIIITSVIPPELPMELSLAVTNSVAALIHRCQVYCTEIFRIPLAGEVNVCCFDKTGTITSDEMRLLGVRLFGDAEKSDDEDAALLNPDENLTWPARRVMAGCHSLALGNIRTRATGTVIGDPLEQVVLKHSGYQLKGNNVVAPTDTSAGFKTITILHRFAFSSKIKRMTVLVTEADTKGTIWALTKGAPETIKEHCTKNSIPPEYDDISFYHMSRGRRVLAMAHREIDLVKNIEKIKENGRERIENDLTFVGFLVLDCPLKPDSKSVIVELRKSGHKNVMITGDALLTAAEVARQVGIIRKTAATSVFSIVAVSNKKEGHDPLENFEYIPLKSEATGNQRVKLSLPLIKDLINKSEKGEVAFCITGDILVQIALQAFKSSNILPCQTGKVSTTDEKSVLLHESAQSILKEIVPLISVFGRHAPHQKEAVVAAFNHAGFHSLMCGDGTNDVGALKRAHVGISIISAPEVEAKQRAVAEGVSRARNQEKNGRKKRMNKDGHHRMTWEESIQKMKEAQEELDQVELGDASVAAPFTSRAVSIKCCKDVIQQGRCTLVTMLQIYKILGINCLVNAMVLSKLFLHGVKQGDRQLTILGVVVAGLFYFVTRAEPLAALSATRPPTSILCTQALLSIAIQFIIHLAAILIATEAALFFVDPYDPSLVPDGPFNPNVLNTCTFLLTCLATINTFAVNYRGRPFMQSLRDNKFLYRGLLVCYASLAVCALEIFPPLNDLLQLTTLPSGIPEGKTVDGVLASVLTMIDFPILIFALMVTDTALAFGVERVLLKLFP